MVIYKYMVDGVTSETSVDDVAAPGGVDVKVPHENKGLILVLCILVVCIVGLIGGIVGVKTMRSENQGQHFSLCGWGFKDVDGNVNTIFAHEFAMKIEETLMDNSDYNVADANNDYLCEIESSEYDGTTIRLVVEYAEFLNSYYGLDDAIKYLENYFHGYMENAESDDDLAGYYVDLAFAFYIFSEDTELNYMEEALSAAGRAEELAPTWQSAKMICLIALNMNNVDEAREYYALAIQRGYDDMDDDFEYK